MTNKQFKNWYNSINKGVPKVGFLISCIICAIGIIVGLIVWAASSYTLFDIFCNYLIAEFFLLLAEWLIVFGIAVAVEGFPWSDDYKESD